MTTHQKVMNTARAQGRHISRSQNPNMAGDCVGGFGVDLSDEASLLAFCHSFGFSTVRMTGRYTWEHVVKDGAKKVGRVIVGIVDGHA